MLWEPWYLVDDTGVVLPDLGDVLPAGPTVMLDLTGFQPRLGSPERDTMAALAPGTPYVVSSRRWWMLDAFDGVPTARVVHPVRTGWVLRLLARRLRRHPTWWVALHGDLLAVDVVVALRRSADVVLTWPIDSPADTPRALALGAEGLIADDLSVLPG